MIELKATPNGNPSNDFYWKQKSSSLNVVHYITTSRPIIIHLQICIAVTEQVRNTFNLVFLVFLQLNSGVFPATKLFLSSLNQPNQSVKNIKYIDKASIKSNTNYKYKIELKFWLVYKL